MKFLSRMISTLGLLALVGAIILFPQAMPDGATLYRWDRLSYGLSIAIACFLLAALLSRKKNDE
ncbi:MAG: hypothetical protein AAGC86_07935 [Pseudomonadota bacterium]